MVASNKDQPQVQNFLRRREVCERTGLKTSTLYEMMQDGRFPRPIRISKRLVVWPESEVAAWQAGRIAERDEIAEKMHGARDRVAKKLQTVRSGS